MSVQIKPLKGFSNPINNESNTLSLLVKSDYELYEHLSKAKEKLILSLTSILNYFKDSEIKFYHKVQIPNKHNYIYITTRCYKLSLNTLKEIIDDSLKKVINLCPNSYTSHFVNVVAKKDGNTIILNNNEFIELNRIIRDSINNNHTYEFSNNNNFEKAMKKVEKRIHILQSKQK